MIKKHMFVHLKTYVKDLMFMDYSKPKLVTS